MFYLILHKVRGEPAFDIAEKIQIGDEEGWIIPTSGHRAYPYRHWELDALADISDISSFGFHVRPATVNDIPDDWPDHYSCEDTGTITSGVNVMALISKNLLGKIKRRL